MPSKPFQIVEANRSSEKGKSYSNLPVDISGKLWANIEFNNQGQYGFKDDSFNLKIKFAVGTVDDAGHKWLIGSFENGDQLFDIKDQKANGVKDDGSGKPKYEATPKEEEIKQAWIDDGKLTAILCDPIPQLVLLVEETKGKMIFAEEGYEVFCKLNPDSALFKEINAEIVEAKPDNPSPQRKKNPQHKKFLSENSWFFYAWEEDSIIDCLSATAYEVELLAELETVSIEFDSEGYLEDIKFDWKAPEVKASSQRKGGYGSSAQSEAEILKERKSFVFAEMGVNSWEQLIQEYGKTLCPIKTELVVAIANGASWHNRFYSSPVDLNQYSVSTPVETNGNGKSNAVEAKKVEIVEPTEEKKKQGRPSSFKAELESLKESEEENEAEELTASGENWVEKIQELKEHEPEYIIPKEINEVFLTEQGDTWCRLFYTLMTGQLITTKGSIDFTNRSALAFIKSKCGKFPQKMTESDLRAVLKNEAIFVPSPDSVVAL